MASTVEYSARVNHHAGRMNLASDHTFCLNLHATLGKNHAIETTRNYHVVPFDLSFNLRAFAKNNRLLGDDITLHVSVNTEGALNLQRAFNCDALIDEACPLVTRATLSAARPSPCHKTSPRNYLLTLTGCSTKSTKQT